VLHSKIFTCAKECPKLAGAHLTWNGSLPKIVCDPTVWSHIAGKVLWLWNGFKPFNLY